MQRRLQDGHAIVLEHVQQGGFARIVQAKEEEFGVFVRETEGGEEVPDCRRSGELVVCSVVGIQESGRGRDVAG